MIGIPLKFVTLVEVVVRKCQQIRIQYDVCAHIGKVIVFILLMIFISVIAAIFREFALFAFVGRARFGVILLCCLFFRCLRL